MQKTALIILANGFEEIEAITPIDLLRRAGIHVTIAGLNSLTIAGRSAITLTCDKLLSECQTLFDALILPGGMPGTKNLLESKDVLQQIKTHFVQNRLIAAICAAPTVLASAGILNQKKVTCYPGNQEKLLGGIFSNEDVTVDSSIITARSAGCAIDFSLEIIRYLCGNNLSEEVSGAIVYSN